MADAEMRARHQQIAALEVAIKEAEQRIAAKDIGRRGPSKSLWSPEVSANKAKLRHSERCWKNCVQTIPQ